MVVVIPLIITFPLLRSSVGSLLGVLLISPLNIELGQGHWPPQAHVLFRKTTGVTVCLHVLSLSLSLSLSSSLYVYIYIYITYVYIYIYTYVCMYVYAHNYICIHIYNSLSLSIYIYVVLYLIYSY